MPMMMDINTAKAQMGIEKEPGYAFMQSFAEQDVAMSPQVESAWAQEIARRRDDVLSGKVTLVSGEEVFRKAMAKYA